MDECLTKKISLSSLACWVNIILNVKLCINKKQAHMCYIKVCIAQVVICIYVNN